ncbi:unnamed protein product [Schistosoma turkestanicum]|nr:unnamed protein product [Schistosoma turkestanicum]
MLAIADIGVVICIGWISLFPAYGLPFASSGTIYYFTLTRSTISCKLSIFFQTFFCTLRGNIFIVLAVDRFVLIHKPLIYNKLSKYFNCYILFIVILITLAMTLPFGILIELNTVRKLSACWFVRGKPYIPIHQTLFSNTCPIQLSLVTLFDSFFVLKVIQWKRKLQQVSSTSSSSSASEVNISFIITMLIVQIVAFLFSLPSSITYLIALVINFENASSEYVRLLILIINMAWNMIFLQSSLNIFIYYYRIRKFRQILQHYLQCHCDLKSISQTNSIITTGYN